MIFNKDNKGNEELRALTGSYYKSNDFLKIGMQIELASEDMISLIGNDIFVKAELHYQSVNYQLANPTPNLALLDKLVQHIQLPVAFMATLRHYQGNDLSHEDSGRKVKIDKESESLAWEWMYDRDDAAALRNYQRSFDRLIKFLNGTGYPEWDESEARKDGLSLFINTADHFNQLFPIDSSPVFFLRLVPLMREVERKYIKPILGTEKFNVLKAAIQSGKLSGTDEELYDYVCDPIPLITMSMAVKRFSLTVIPEGVVQNFFSERQTAKANLPAPLDVVNDVSKSLRKDGLDILNDLKKYWSALNADETNQDITDMLPSATSTDKFIGL
ncbi:MAG: DUF6712 family protein [Mangrovibacterium sp.]